MYENNAFVKFDGITGESKAKGHEDWVGLQFFSFGIINSTATDLNVQSFGSGKGILRQLALNINYDKALVTLQQYAILGKHIATIEIDMLHAVGDKDPKIWAKYTLTNTYITEISNGQPSDNSAVLAVRPQKIKAGYTPADYTGKPQAEVTWTWDLQLQTIE
ncbi:Hcp family type VI secretion system effector [Xenorhabdus sp. IM139775]|uniref:Hcp family type VI secretion system effector n=1 Tax=Xenorhabdus sp. IM139775 TaxID=3025876 RepID=UPI002359D987|nr:type VI secretion system tube protein Hcp [Xenorhabdus sp. IM139775]MDC9592073.1 type VI secretion system tube protein Hcp [Xenorhabdus sp. IM139775]